MRLSLVRMERLLKIFKFYTLCFYLLPGIWVYGVGSAQHFRRISNF